MPPGNDDHSQRPADTSTPGGKPDSNFDPASDAVVEPKPGDSAAVENTLPSDLSRVPASHGQAAPTEQPETLNSNVNEADARLIGQRWNALEPAIGTKPNHEPTRPDQLDPTVSRKGQPPQQIGRYHIVRLLGKGAFGKVFLAHDPYLDRPVAVKVAMESAMPEDSEIDRFLREARSAAQLHHPNIAAAHEYGQSQGLKYIAYEYIEGGTLKHLMEGRSKLPPAEAVQLVIRICDALDYAHRQGIVHRDIKPDNILMNQANEPLITDFGCARREQETTRTIEGYLMGTPAYMSPEQASGAVSDIDGRSDVWSVGVMLYEMLAGRRPFKGNLKSILEDIIRGDYPALRTVDPQLPRDLETICERSVQVDLEKRFSTAGEMRDELQRWQRGEPILSRRVSLLYRTWRWAARNRAVATLLTTVAATLLAGMILSSYFAIRANYFSIQATRAERARALDQVDAFTGARPEALTTIAESMNSFRDDVIDEIDRKSQQPAEPDEARRLRLARVMLARAGDNRNAAYEETIQKLFEDLLSANADEFLQIRNVLVPPHSELHDAIWRVAMDIEESPPRRFRAAAAAALISTDDSRWNTMGPDIAQQLTAESSETLPAWCEALRPVAPHLQDKLKEMYLAGSRENDRVRATEVIANLFNKDFDFLLKLVPAASPEQLVILIRAFRQNQTGIERQKLLDGIDKLFQVHQLPTSTTEEEMDLSTIASANLLIARMELTQGFVDWASIFSSDNPGLRLEWIERCGAGGLNFSKLRERISELGETGTNPEQLATLLLALEAFPENRLLQSDRQRLLPLLTELYQAHPNAAVHSAAEWLMHRWNYEEHCTACEKQLAEENSVTESSATERQWFVDASGITVVTIDSCEYQLSRSFAESSNAAEAQMPAQQTVVLPRRFAIASRELTSEQYAEFEEHLVNALPGFAKSAAEAGNEKLSKQLEARVKAIGRQQKSRTRKGIVGQRPIGNLTFYDVGAFCRWLDEQHDVPEDQHVFPAIETIQRLYCEGKSIPLDNDDLQKSGYRIPTAREWEYAARYTETVRWPLPISSRLLQKHAWYKNNARELSNFSGLLKPNPQGLFDAFGNANEWCIDWNVPVSREAKVVDVFPETVGFNRVVRGGSYLSDIDELRSGEQSFSSPRLGHDWLGMRLAKTLKP